MNRQSKEIEAMLKRKYGQLKPVQLLMTIPGIGLVSALIFYADICDVKRLSNAEKLAHYAGLVPKVRQSGEHIGVGRSLRVISS
jgi:transposase